MAVRGFHEDILVPPNVFRRRNGTVAVCPRDEDRGDLAGQRKYSGETEKTHLAGRNEVAVGERLEGEG